MSVIIWFLAQSTERKTLIINCVNISKRFVQIHRRAYEYVPLLVEVTPKINISLVEDIQWQIWNINLKIEISGWQGTMWVWLDQIQQQYIKEQEKQYQIEDKWNTKQ